MENGKLNIDGIDIAYTRRGKGAPLVLIHGYPLDHSIWDEVAQLLEGDFDVITPDLRGFGESGVIEADHSIIGYASDIAGLLEHFKVRKAVLVGHSMGGYVALAFAREFPERVSGLGLVSSQSLSDTPERKQGRYATAKQVLAEGVRTVAEEMTPKLSADAGVQAYVRALISKQQPLAIASALEAMADRPDSTDILKAFRFPVLIVHGADDALIPVERGRSMKLDLPSAHYVELPTLGHMPMMEDERAMADAIRFFLGVKANKVKILST
jgi:pimeloyl-ACP methyl ester carboxylesterase